LKLAVQAASEETFSVAILDVRLGRETTQQVVEILARRAIPFVFYTGQEVPEEIRSIYAPSAVLAKPADQKLLVDTIVRILRTPVQKARSEKGFAKAAPAPGTHGATRDPG
jgi:DNA-binding NtrC family response regulator